MKESEDDAISLSFVDCMSCGLAAAMFLFLVFAAIPRAQVAANAALRSGAESTQGRGLIPMDARTSAAISIPMDIEIRLNQPLLAAGGEWSGADTSFHFRENNGLARLFVASIVDSTRGFPTFSVVRGLESVSQPLGGRIVVRVGSIAIEKAFVCRRSVSNSPLDIRILAGRDEDGFVVECFDR